MTIHDSLYFSYAGRKSVEFGILNVSINSGMVEEPLAAPRDLNEFDVKNRDRPYFQSIKKQPLKFNVSFAFEDTWDDIKLREVTRWLTNHDYYKELYFTNDIGRNPEKIYYAIVIDDPTLVHNSLKQGYINLSFRCDAPYAYSLVKTSREYIWDKSEANIAVTDFSSGEKKSVIASNSIILNPHKTKWSDFSRTMTWAELDQLFT
ncbi:Phage tail protein [compost metagenome]